MENKVLTSHNKSWTIDLAMGAFFSAGYLVIGELGWEHGNSFRVWWVILGVLFLILAVAWAWKMVVAGKGAVILDAEGIVLHNCAAKVVAKNKVERVGTVSLKWSDVEGVEERLIKTASGEVYTDWDGNVIGKLYPKPKYSPFGEKGWAEINRYYTRYKEANKQ